MPGVEFLPERPDAPDAGRPDRGRDRGRTTRWLIPFGIALVALAGVVIGLNHDSSTPHAAAAPSSVPAAPSLTLRAPLVVGDGLGMPLAVTRDPALDVAVTGSTSWVLTARTVHRVAQFGGQAAVAVPGRALPDSTTAAARLIPDVPGGVIWVVEEGVRGGRAIAYDLASLRVVRDVAIGSVVGAAALDGHLYLTTGNRLLDIAPGEPPLVAARMPTLLGPVVADTARGRLLMSDYGRDTHIWPITPGPRPHVGHPVTVRVTKASLGTAQGAIWLAGYDTGAGVLMRLDPRTLQPALHSPLDPLLYPGATIAASGTRVIWVRDGSELRCVDPSSGGQLQTWIVDGPVASGGGTALVGTPFGAVPLQLSGCSG
jgi:hypothetical protein